MLERFLKLQPAYAETAALDELRARDYARLDAENQVYLDFTGASLYADSQIREHAELLTSGVFGNPHSANPTSSAATRIVERARAAVLSYFNCDEDYTAVFTLNASGALKLVGDLLKRVFTAGPMARLGYVLARGGLKRLKEWLDPRKYNGAVLLGLNGVVVKSHGGADAEGFAHAVDVAMDMINNDFNDKIKVLLAAMDRAILASDLADANV